MKRARGSSLLVTGTDTGIGKTFVGTALGAALAGRMKVAVFKPAETGCREVDGELLPEDAVRLRDAAACDAPLELVCPYRYAEPLAPWVAAERAGRPIDPARLRSAFESLRTNADLVLVESAGGLVVPLTRTYSFADLAHELALPILLVVGSRLGALNQALLTLEVARHRGLEVRGIVMNHLSNETDLARQTNVRTLAALADAPILASLPFHTDAAGLARSELARIGEPLAELLFPPS